jgi:hypothetical protein
VFPLLQSHRALSFHVVTRVTQSQHAADKLRLSVSVCRCQCRSRSRRSTSHCGTDSDFTPSYRLLATACADTPDSQSTVSQCTFVRLLLSSESVHASGKQALARCTSSRPALDICTPQSRAPAVLYSEMQRRKLKLGYALKSGVETQVEKSHNFAPHRSSCS